MATRDFSQGIGFVIGSRQAKEDSSPDSVINLNKDSDVVDNTVHERQKNIFEIKQSLDRLKELQKKLDSLMGEFSDHIKLKKKD